jgi:hypothetical protein
MARLLLKEAFNNGGKDININITAMLHRTSFTLSHDLLFMVTHH